MDFSRSAGRRWRPLTAEASGKTVSKLSLSLESGVWLRGKKENRNKQHSQRHSLRRLDGEKSKWICETRLRRERSLQSEWLGHCRGAHRNAESGERRRRGRSGRERLKTAHFASDVLPLGEAEPSVARDARITSPLTYRHILRFPDAFSVCLHLIYVSRLPSPLRSRLSPAAGRWDERERTAHLEFTLTEENGFSAKS